MKTQFKREVNEPWFNKWTGVWEMQWSERYRVDGRYSHKYANYFRHIKTFNERRKNNSAIQDGYKVRGKRRPNTIPTTWDDISIKRNWKRSWKDFTKYRKQYLKNLD